MTDASILDDSRKDEFTNQSGGVDLNASVDTVGGDFVGRDQIVFAGRDTVPVVNIYGDGNVVRDVTIYPSTSVGRIGAQIQRLRGRITRLIPTEEALRSLSTLREPSTISSRANNISSEFSLTVPLSIFGRMSAKLNSTPKETPKVEPEPTNEYLKRLNDLEAQLSLDLEQSKLSALLQSLSEITDEVNVRIARLNNLFVSLVYPATSSVQVFLNMVTKIGHRDLREEAKMHLEVIKQLVEKIDADLLTQKGLDVLSDEAQSAVGVITEIEKHRLVVEKLLQQDKRKRNWTTTVVIVYIVSMIGLTIFFAVSSWGTQVTYGNLTLNELKLPLIGIPWPVLVWSLIGSFAAMLYRFNRRPIYDFGEVVKWLITRPVQGVVLGSAFYLVFASGLFLLTGGNGVNPTKVDTADQVVLVLVFLVGFSDRFADSVFNALVERYSSGAKEERPDSTTTGGNV